MITEIKSRIDEARIVRHDRGIGGALRHLISTERPIELRRRSTDSAAYRQVFIDDDYAFDYPRDPSVIVDAGAHIGCASVWFARRFPRARIISVELDRANFELLERNTSRLANVTAIHAALWPTSGQVSIENPDDETWSFRATEGEGVGAVTIPELMERFGIDRIDLLKLDIEGAEADVLAASGPWIGDVDMVVAELHDRFVPGCTEAFDKATEQFPMRVGRGENVLVAR